jgi:hypothetical protein
MIKKPKLSYTYIFEQKDKTALKTWLKANKLKLKDIHDELDVSYVHLKRIVTGKRTASPRILNILRKKGVKFPKD